MNHELIQPGGLQLVLLGTGTPVPDPERSGPSAAVMVDEQAYLVDFGPGVVRSAAAASERYGLEALDASNLCIAFLTHLHSDHTAGFADLLLTPWVVGRFEPLQIYGPPGTGTLVEHTRAAHQEDIDLRLDGLEPSNVSGCQTIVTEIETGLVYEDDRLRVEAFPVKHGSWKKAFGFRFQGADRSIVFSGDTVPVTSLIEKARGCDILVHEVYSQTQFDILPEEWQEYHTAFHTSTRQLAEIANQVRPGLLVLYHQLFWGATEEQLLAEIRQDYDGEVISGRDLDVF